MDDRLLELCVAAMRAEALWITNVDGEILWRSANATPDVTSGAQLRGRRVRTSPLDARDSCGERFVIVVHTLFRRGSRAGQALHDAGLTPAEVAVAELVGRGSSTAATASKLNIRPQTVRSHLRRIYEKLDLHSRSELLEAFTNHMLR
jgi:DNA-binding CsgD family transcriptional regulator